MRVSPTLRLTASKGLRRISCAERNASFWGHFPWSWEPTAFNISYWLLFLRVWIHVASVWTTIPLVGLMNVYGWFHGLRKFITNWQFRSNFPAHEMWIKLYSSHPLWILSPLDVFHRKVGLTLIFSCSFVSLWWLLGSFASKKIATCCHFLYLIPNGSAITKLQIKWKAIVCFVKDWLFIW
jgi:hypothetical protein